MLFEEVVKQIAANPCNALQRKLSLALSGQWPYSPSEEQCLNLLTSGHPLHRITTQDERDITTYSDFCGPWVLTSELEAFKAKYQAPYLVA